MRRCFGCGSTIGLKGITFPDCDCGKCSGFHNKSCCKSCYFSEEVSCEMDGHSNVACIVDNNCKNHENTVELYNHWDSFDYNFKPKAVKKKQ